MFALALTIALPALGLLCSAPAARADTITEYCPGCTGAGFGARFNSAEGQSVTTPTGVGWGNIVFNFYNSSGGSLAFGDIYLLDQPYSGLAADLSSSTAGYIASATASGGTSYVFDPSVALQPGTQYYFYTNASSGGTGVAEGPNSYAGGQGYTAFNFPPANYSATGADFEFTLSGTPAPGPIPGTGLLSYLVAGLGGLISVRKRLRAGAVALLAPGAWGMPSR